MVLSWSKCGPALEKVQCCICQNSGQSLEKLQCRKWASVVLSCSRFEPVLEKPSDNGLLCFCLAQTLNQPWKSFNVDNGLLYSCLGQKLAKHWKRFNAVFVKFRASLGKHSIWVKGFCIFSWSKFGQALEKLHCRQRAFVLFS